MRARGLGLALRTKGMTTVNTPAASRRVFSFVVGFALLGACGPSEETPACPGEVPPQFSITVRAYAGPLPSDTVLTLHYGGGVETYELARPEMPHSVMLCDPEPAALPAGGAAGAAGADAVPPSVATEALRCELWIEGSATIKVTGGGYPDLSHELQGQANECGAKTVEKELVLGETGTDSDDD